MPCSLGLGQAVPRPVRHTDLPRGPPLGYDPAAQQQTLPGFPPATTVNAGVPCPLWPGDGMPRLGSWCFSLLGAAWGPGPACGLTSGHTDASSPDPGCPPAALRLPVRGFPGHLEGGVSFPGLSLSSTRASRHSRLSHEVRPDTVRSPPDTHTPSSFSHLSHLIRPQRHPARLRLETFGARPLHPESEGASHPFSHRPGPGQSSPRPAPGLLRSPMGSPRATLGPRSGGIRMGSSCPQRQGLGHCRGPVAGGIWPGPPCCPSLGGLLSRPQTATGSVYLPASMRRLLCTSFTPPPLSVRADAPLRARPGTLSAKTHLPCTPGTLSSLKVGLLSCHVAAAGPAPGTQWRSGNVCRMSGWPPLGARAVQVSPREGGQQRGRGARPGCAREHRQSSIRAGLGPHWGVGETGGCHREKNPGAGRAGVQAGPRA